MDNDTLQHDDKDNDGEDDEDDEDKGIKICYHLL